MCWCWCYCVVIVLVHVDGVICVFGCACACVGTIRTHAMISVVAIVVHIINYFSDCIGRVVEVAAIDIMYDVVGGCVVVIVVGVVVANGCVVGVVDIGVVNLCRCFCCCLV